MTGRALLGTAVFALFYVACSRRAPMPTPPSKSASAPVRAPTSASATAALPEPAPSADAFVSAKACRAIAVKGKVVREGGAPLMLGDVLDAPVWLDLAKGAEFVVKHVETTRELTFKGPGRILPCDRGEERFLVVRGHVGTQTWAGARPGAEVIVATPFGAVRYGDAKLEIDVDDKGLRVRSESGDAWIDGTGNDADPVKVAAGNHGERRGPALEVKTLVAQCDTAAAAAEARARDVLTPTSGASPLGIRAAEHVRARHAARAACSIAAAAVGTLEMGQNRDELTQKVATSDALWRSVPSRVRPPQKVESR